MTSNNWPKALGRSALLAILFAAPACWASDAPATPEPGDPVKKMLEKGLLDPAKPIERPAARPVAGPGETVPSPKAGPKSEAQVKADTTRLFDFLMKEYAALLGKSKDRMGRSLAIVCLARIPRADATAELLNLLKNERDPLVKMVAWECLLARANGLRESEYKQWAAAAGPLFAAGAFKGNLRVPLLQVLALSPPDAAAKEAFSKIFRETNSTDPQDYATLVALGETVRAWGEGAAVEALIGQLSDINNAQRAEVVLRAAGADDVAVAFSRRELGSDAMWKQAKQDYESWWAKEKATWKPLKAKAESGEWTKLPAQYVPRVDMAATADPYAKTWYKDLELRVPSLKTFSVGLLVDTTGSMEQVLVWLRADVKRMMQALGVIALEPQITLTFYRDFGDSFVSKTIPLTGRTETLVRALNTMDAHGGGDIPEAVREAVQDSLANGNWPTSAKQPKAIVLIGDAPPHPETQAECEKLVADAAAKGFRLYAVKVMTGYEASDLSAFDRLAEAGHGAALWSDLREAQMMASRRGMGARAMNRLAHESAVDHATPGEWVVTKVIADAISPQYEDRVKPPVAILWQMLKEPTAEKHEPFMPPPRNDGKMPKERMKPRDVQAR